MKGRHYGFDVLRGGASLLGIVLHAVLTHMTVRLHGVIWVLDDVPQSRACDLVFWYVHAWRMPLFFLMGGYFAAQLGEGRGASGFARHRLNRLVLPLVVACLTILPTMYAVWGTGWFLEGRATWHELRRMRFDEPLLDLRVINPAHLWFLFQLITMSAVYWLWLRLRPPTSSPGTRAPILLLFAAPTAIWLALDPGCYQSYPHVLPHQLALLWPQLSHLGYFSVFFLAGVTLRRRRGGLEALAHGAWWYLLAAQGLFALCLPLIDRSLHPEPDWPTRVGLGATVALFCWTTLRGLVGVVQSQALRRPRAWVAWLSDGAYWVYLAHLPLVGLMALALRDSSLAPLERAAVAVLVSAGLTLASYQLFVRHTVIGRALHGPRAG